MSVRGVGVVRGYLIYCIIYPEKLATGLRVAVKNALLMLGSLLPYPTHCGDKCETHIKQAVLLPRYHSR